MRRLSQPGEHSNPERRDGRAPDDPLKNAFLKKQDGEGAYRQVSHYKVDRLDIVGAPGSKR